MTRLCEHFLSYCNSVSNTEYSGNSNYKSKQIEIIFSYIMRAVGVIIITLLKWEIISSNTGVRVIFIIRFTFGSEQTKNWMCMCIRLIFLLLMSYTYMHFQRWSCFIMFSTEITLMTKSFDMNFCMRLHLIFLLENLVAHSALMNHPMHGVLSSHNKALHQGVQNVIWKFWTHICFVPQVNNVDILE